MCIYVNSHTALEEKNRMQKDEVRLLSEEGAKEYLKEIIIKLDELDEQDFFGSEGWRHFMMGED